MSREEIMNDLQEPQEEDHELERFLSIMREYYKTHKFTGAVDKQAVLLYLKEILAEHGMIIHLPEEPTNQQPPLEPYENAISRASVEYICQKNTVSTNPYEHKYHDKFIQFMDDPEISDFGRWQHSNGFNTALVAVKCDLDKVPPMQPQ